MLSLGMNMTGKRLMDSWGRLSQKCLWKNVMINRELSLSGRVSLSLRQLILDMCKQGKTESNCTQNKNGKLCQLTLLAFSWMFIKGNHSKMKEEIKYRILSKSPPKFNSYENITGLVNYNGVFQGCLPWNRERSHMMGNKVYNPGLCKLIAAR